MSILTTQEFLNMGFPISDDIDTYRIQLSIDTVEGTCIKDALTNEHYLDLVNNPSSTTNYILLNGGTIDDIYYLGLKKAIGYITFAWLMSSSYQVTRYGTVLKRSEFSDNKVSIDEDDLNIATRRYLEVGIRLLKETMKYYELDTTKNVDTLGLNTIVY